MFDGWCVFMIHFLAPITSSVAKIPPKYQSKLLTEFNDLGVYNDMLESMDSELIALYDRYAGMISPWLNIGCFPETAWDEKEAPSQSFVTVTKNAITEMVFNVVTSTEDRLEICDDHDVWEIRQTVKIYKCKVPFYTIMDSTGFLKAIDILDIVGEFWDSLKENIPKIKDSSAYYKNKFGYVIDINNLYHEDYIFKPYGQSFVSLVD